MKLRHACLTLLLSVAMVACQQVPVENTSADERAAVRTRLAAEYFKRRQFGIAMEEAQKALAINAGYAPAFSMLALINMEIREDAQARKYFLKALELAPRNPDFHHNYGYFLCERDELRAGIQHYMQALRDPLYPTPDRTLVAAGFCAEKGKWENEAREYYERALRYQPASNQAKFFLASLLLKNGEFSEARPHALDLARQANPGAEDLWLAVRVERKLGNKDGERRFADQLKRLYPDSLETSRLLAGQYD